MEFWHNKNEYIKSTNKEFCRLHLLEQTNNNSLTLDNLKLHGLKSAPQRPVKVIPQLSDYINFQFNYYANNDIFPETMDIYIEGASTFVIINKYERSSEARTKCIEIKGCKCSICNFDFEKYYGAIGSDFIHVHHIVPLSQINKSYTIDYNDLIPVCPNCHAMLHRKANNEYLTIDKLKEIITHQVKKP